jgi:hypothetical protein
MAEYMKKSPEIAGPECSRCQKPMEWLSVQFVGAQPVNVFHCETCEKFAAAAASTAESLNL